jgi:hypothetical protein
MLWCNAGGLANASDVGTGSFNSMEYSKAAARDEFSDAVGAYGLSASLAVVSTGKDVVTGVVTTQTLTAWVSVLTAFSAMVEAGVEAGQAGGFSP